MITHTRTHTHTHTRWTLTWTCIQAQCGVLSSMQFSLYSFDIEHGLWWRMHGEVMEVVSSSDVIEGLWSGHCNAVALIYVHEKRWTDFAQPIAKDIHAPLKSIK